MIARLLKPLAVVWEMTSVDGWQGGNGMLFIVQFVAHVEPCQRCFSGQGTAGQNTGKTWQHKKVWEVKVLTSAYQNKGEKVIQSLDGLNNPLLH